jgi:hypothetical protein
LVAKYINMASKEARKLLFHLADKVDKVLFEHGLVFAKEDDDAAWAVFLEELRALVYKHYEDEQGSADESYKDDASASDAEDEPSCSWDEEAGEYKPPSPLPVAKGSKKRAVSSK